MAASFAVAGLCAIIVDTSAPLPWVWGSLQLQKVGALTEVNHASIIRLHQLMPAVDEYIREILCPVLQ